ncbi:MAG: hypothetical protein AAFX65_08570 [Cyanobacteria bacterium J06638_7]
MTAGTSSRLRVGQAVEDGWQAFRRSPWPFVFFALLVGVLSAIVQAIGNAGINEEGEVLGAGGLIAALVSLIGSTIVSLWGTTGLVRGAWMALEGRRPAFADFSRWDGAAATRLFVRQLALALVILVIAAVAAVVAFGLMQINQLLVWIPAVVALAVFVYLAVNQKFIAYVALLQQRGPLDTIQHGRQVVDPSWWSVVLLLIVESAIILVGLLLCGVGLVAAFPLALCISTAAYRQLFGSDDQTGLAS